MSLNIKIQDGRHLLISFFVCFKPYNPHYLLNFTRETRFQQYVFISCGIVSCILTCVGKLTIIGSDNGLSPGRRQAIIWTNAGILLIGPLGTNFSEISIAIETFSFKKMHLKMSSAKWRPFCLGLNVLTRFGLVTPNGNIDLWINIGSGNHSDGLLPDRTKSLPDPMLTSHWLVLFFFTFWADVLCNEFENTLLNSLPYIPRANELENVSQMVEVTFSSHPRK